MASRRPSTGTLTLTYYPLCLLCVTTVLNSLTLIILYQKVFRGRSTLHYMRAIAIVDMLSLYGWNLGHFIYFKLDLDIDRSSILSCKLSIYFNHFITQSSAWLRVGMCIDRYYTLTQVRQRRALHSHRRVLLIIALILLAIALINLHLPIGACHYKKNNTKIVHGSSTYHPYPVWNYVNLAMYNIIPFIIMLGSNVLIIRHLILIKRTSTLQQSRIRHSSISLPILLSTFLFCIMTTPPAIIKAFFHSPTNAEIIKDLVIVILDCIKYTYHSLAFFLYFLTLAEFRRECFRLLRCQWLRSNLSLCRIGKTASRTTTRYGTQLAPISTITK